MAQPADLRTLNADLVALRDNAGLSQEDLADALNELAQRRFGRQVEITKKTVGRWERGEVTWPQPFYRRLLAEYFHVAVDELGFRRPRPATSELHRGASTSPDDLLTLAAAPGPQDLRIEKDQQQWRDVREALGRRRQPLAVLAEQLYPDHQVPGLEHTGVIAHPAWLPTDPIPLGQVVLDRVDDAPPPVVSGSERESAAVRPLASAEQRYRRYSHAVRDLASPVSSRTACASACSASAGHGRPCSSTSAPWASSTRSTPTKHSPTRLRCTTSSATRTAS